MDEKEQSAVAGGEQKRTKADSGAVITEEQAREFAAKAAAEGKPRLRILTGDRTTGKLHIGHYVGSLKHRVNYQSVYDTYVLMADVQALTTHYDRPEILKQSVREVILDYLAVGIDPYTGGVDDGTKTKIVVQSLVPSIAELTVYYGLLVPVRSLIDNPTTKAEAEQHGFGFEIPDAVRENMGERLFLELVRVAEKLRVDHPEISEVRPDILFHSLTAFMSNNRERYFQLYGEQTEQDSKSVSYEKLVESILSNLELQRLLLEEVKKELRKKGFYSVPYGFLGYPISQAADITFVGAHLVPVGPDYFRCR